MATLNDLAGQSDFRLGPIEISPSRRMLSGPSGTAQLEPIIMQALLILVEGLGGVVTRDQLFTQCWGAAAVGDDSLNRAIAKVRRALEKVAPGAFEIETVPRTGYRLVDRTGWAATTGSGEPALVSRRLVVGGGAAIAAASGGFWLFNRSRPDPRFKALMRRGDEAFRDGSAFEWSTMIPNKSERMVKLYEQAVQIEPDDARAWGLLGYFRGVHAQGVNSERAPAAMSGAMTAINRSLALDPGEPNARVGRFLFEGRTLDWIARDRQLRAILAAEPGNMPAMLELMPLLQAAGLTRESWDFNERILAVSPTAKAHLVAKAMKLWILGKTPESDNLINRVRAMWPDYAFGHSVRMMIFGLTGRPHAALAMIDSAGEKVGRHRTLKLWKTALVALAQDTAATRAEARAALIESARVEPVGVNDIVMLLGALDMTDAAFEVAEGYILWRGKVVTKDLSDGSKMDAYNRRMTQWLFTPTLAKMRAEPRFQRLCDETGLSAYWRSRGIQPDYLRYA